MPQTDAEPVAPPAAPPEAVSPVEAGPRPLTVDELSPFFVGMPSDIGSLVRELAITRYELAAARHQMTQPGA